MAKRTTFGVNRWLTNGHWIYFSLISFKLFKEYLQSCTTEIIRAKFREGRLFITSKAIGMH